MVISGDFRVSGTFAASPVNPLRHSFANSKVGFNNFLTGRSGSSDITPKWPHIKLERSNMLYHRPQSFRVTGENKLSPKPLVQEAENFLLRAINMSFSERLNLAWKILFPPVPATRKNSNAKVAKQRLQMILFADRCAVTEEAKEKIVSKVISALSDFVIIDSEDKVQLSVSTDSDLGTLYSVTVPVRRVRPEYQYKDEAGSITNIEYKDTGETSGSVDVTFDFFVPDERTQ